ncbi:MAG TPA: hypothetical protein VHX60_15985 [Acidobacteriaceae bacterium]|jgi:hypothetical protein|nr:hypothetical protein [Acidobacteriaceae bacterium]
MYVLSAVDAVSPAVQRTKAFLFTRNRFGTYLKLCLVAVVTEGLGGNSNFSSNWSRSSSHHQQAFAPMAWSPVVIAAGIAMFLLAMLLFGFLAYLVTRLRFAYFHCLSHHRREIRPGWHLYRSQAGRFFWLSVVVGICFMAVVLVLALPFIAGFVALYRTVQAGGHPDFATVFALILPLIPLVVLLVVLALALDVVLRDLMLPHMALENATAGQAWSGAWARIRAEKGQFFVFGLLRIFLPVVAAIGLFIVLIIPGLLFFGVVILLEAGIHAALTNATTAATAVGVFLEIVIGVFAAAVALLVGVGCGGPISTAIREYALLFYGGRYQPLGDLLMPPPPPVASAPAVI